MQKIILYSQDISPPCRAVLLLANAIGLKLEIREIDLITGEQFSPEFIKINPHSTIPVLEDNDFVLPDSHAIMCYLVDKYAENDSFYPKDLQKRALVNQFLHFDSGILFPSGSNAIRPIFHNKEKSIPEEKLNLWKEAYKHLNNSLEGRKWLVDDSYTLADISCTATVSTATILLSMDEFPNVKGWIERCEKELPGYNEFILPGRAKLEIMIRSIISQT